MKAIVKQLSSDVVNVTIKDKSEVINTSFKQYNDAANLIGLQSGNWQEDIVSYGVPLVVEVE